MYYIVGMWIYYHKSGTWYDGSNSVNLLTENFKQQQNAQLSIVKAPTED
jgi:hypothetical protein